MAKIQTTMAVGSVTNPYFLNVRITKQLCKKTASVPIFNPVISVVSYSLVSATAAEGQYEAIVNVQGIVTYTPCGSCCAQSQTINENFVVPFYSATAPESVTISGGNPINAMITDVGCKTCCSNLFQSDVPTSVNIMTT